MKKVCTVLLVWLASNVQGALSQEIQTVDRPAWIELKAVYKNMYTRIAPPPEFLANKSPGANFIVTYNGFPAPAQTAFQSAVDIWETLVSSPVTIRVTANWDSLASGVLGSARAADVRRDFAGAPLSGTWYVTPLAEMLAGGDLNHPDSADIIANFNSNRSDWYFGTDGNTPPFEFDLVSVVLHELCHGLGFSGSMTVSGGMGSWGLGTGFPFVYDLFPENGSGQQLINTGIFPNPSAALATELTSNDIYFNSPNAVTANGGTPPKLYAPASWNQGSSYSHLDETTFPAGNPNSLMTFQLGQAEAIHSPGPITLGMFDDVGWNTTPPPPSSVKWEEMFTGTSPPAGWRVIDNDGSGSAMDFRQQVIFPTPPPPDTIKQQVGQSFWFSSFNNANGFLIDEWLISPRVPDIENGDSLCFWAGAVGGSFDDSLRVFISTTDSLLASFTNQIGYFRVDGPVSSWNKYAFDLSAFAGSDIFIAVNYFIVDGGPSGSHSDNVWIDHFIVTTDSTTTSVDDQLQEIPREIVLHQNYPNPFNPSTRISFGLSAASRVRLEVYNTLGQQVATLVDGLREAGFHAVDFDASRFASGTYFYKIQTDKAFLVRKMLLMK
jgi:hypothetical protein